MNQRSNLDFFGNGPYYDGTKPDLEVKPSSDQTVRIRVNKDTHEIDYKAMRESETEHEFTITIKPLGETPNESQPV